MTRTTPKTFVSYVARMSDPLTSPTGLPEPTTPALCTSTSREPNSSRTTAAAASTDSSSVTSSSSIRAPISSAARCQRPASHAPR